MSILYFNNAVDTAWDTIGNWWNDYAASSPSGAIPVDGDDVVIIGGATVGANNSIPLALNTLVFGNSADVSPATNAVNITLSILVIYTDFRSTSINAGTTEQTRFFETSHNTGGIVNGAAEFNGTAYTVAELGTLNSGVNFVNTAIVTVATIAFTLATVAWTGPVMFDVISTGYFDSGSSAQSAVFHDDSYNLYGLIADATFYDGSYNSGPGILNYGRFYDSSYNAGAVSQGDFYGASLNSSTAVVAVANFYNYAKNQGQITDAWFYNFSWNDGLDQGAPVGNITGTAYFYDNTYNVGTTYTSYHYNDSYSSGSSVSTNAEYNDDTFNAGTISNASTFNGNSYNSGIVATISVYDIGAVIENASGFTFTRSAIPYPAASDVALGIQFGYTNQGLITGTKRVGGGINGSSILGMI